MGFTGCGKTPGVVSFVSGRGFSRAEKAANQRASAPEACFSSIAPPFVEFFRSLFSP
jgi:hypothetical protein